MEERAPQSARYEAGTFDAIVVGAGHAGCEAALAAARLGLRTILFAINLDSVANMPCNPSIGGTGKGQLVKEIDALGGEMARAADRTTLQSRMLNASKGPAVWSPRAQIDRRAYQILMKRTLERQPNLQLRQGEVVEVLFETGPDGRRRAAGAVTHTGAVYRVPPEGAVILSTGTYLRGRVIIGDVSYSGGPDGLFPANELSGCLAGAGIAMQRFKTGTPARVNRRSVDFSKMEIQPGDEPPQSMTCLDDLPPFEQLPCHLTWTNAATHGVIRANLHRSPLFSGAIEGVGPRYCPSIEDKVVRFADRERHQIFIEPMGRETEEMYLQGMSSSLPEDVQVDMIRTLPGLEAAQLTRTAYAIEYDCVDPTQLSPALEFRAIGGLFAAGQINGTSGYEEAAAQGVVAGINAAMRFKGKPAVTIDRSQAYIGVLIDDITTKGATEPYRMMTARAEYRLLLRQDNADFRLMPLGHAIGLVSDADHARFLAKKARVEGEVARLRSTVAAPDAAAQAFLESRGSAPIRTGVTLAELLRRPEIGYADLAAIDAGRPALRADEAAQVEITVKYEGYVRRQEEQVEQFRRLEHRLLPEDLDYATVPNLQTEARQKLSKVRPGSVGRAARVQGVTPADIAALLIHVEARRRGERKL